MSEKPRKLRVFLCHTSADKLKVLELYQRLIAEDWIDPWLDSEKILPGQHWTSVIRHSLAEADSVIVLISNNSINREGFVQREMNYAWDLSLEKPRSVIYLIPLRLDDCEVPLDLRERQWADYFGERKDQTYRGLLQSLKLRHEQKLRIEAEEYARQEKQKREREAAERAAREKAEKEAAEKTRLEAEEQAKIKAAKEKAEREAAEKAAREKAEKEAAEKARLKAEKEERQRIAKEKAERETAEKASLEKELWLDRLYTEGLAAFYTEDWDKANQRFQTILKEQPDNKNVTEKLIEIERQKESAEKAAREKAEKESAEKARLETENQARQKAAKEKAEREAAEKFAREKTASESVKELPLSIQDRILEAAIQKQVVVDKPASLYVWIKQSDSKSIISVVKSDIDEDVVLDESNVKSKGLEIEFPIEQGEVTNASISLRLVAPEFSPPTQQKEIKVPVSGDSEVCTFLVTPKKAGKLLLNIEVLKNKVSVANRNLWTMAIGTETKESSPMLLVTIPIFVVVQSKQDVININGNVSDSVIVSGNQNAINVEKAEREAAEKAVREKATKESAEKARLEIEELARQKATREKTEREFVEKAARRKTEGEIVARQKAEAERSPLPRKANPKLSPQILFAVIGTVAVLIFVAIGSPIVSLISRTPTPTVTSTPTKKPTLTKTVIPTATKTKVPTSTPTPTLTPVPQSSILFQDNFSDGNADDWDPSDGTSWVVEKDETGNYIYEITGTENYPQTWPGEGEWSDYAFESRIRIKKGTVFILVRANGSSFYNASINTSDISLARWNVNISEYKVVKSVKYPIQLNKWYLVRVEIVGQQYKLYIDNKLVTSYTYETDSPVIKGGVGYYIGGGETVQIDDVQVWTLK